LDGGFSLFIRCPGALPTIPEFTSDEITICGYLPPRELGNRDLSLEHHITQILQYFAKNVAYNHLQLLRERSSISNVSLPTVKPVTELRMFPLPVKPGHCDFKFRASTIVCESADNLASISHECSRTQDMAFTTAEFSASAALATSTPATKVSEIHDEHSGSNGTHI
jgi:hypothetical protein